MTAQSKGGATTTKTQRSIRAAIITDNVSLLEKLALEPSETRKTSINLLLLRQLYFSRDQECQLQLEQKKSTTRSGTGVSSIKYGLTANSN